MISGRLWMLGAHSAVAAQSRRMTSARPDDDAPFAGSRSGLTRQQLRGHRYTRLTRDVYRLTTSGDADLAGRCRALLVAVPDAAVSHDTAAALHRLPAGSVPLVHLTRPAGRAPVRRPDVVPHVRQLPDDDVVLREGVRVTTPVRTFLDLSATLRLAETVELADAVARRVGIDALRDGVSAAPRRRGLARARAAVRLADPGAESPGESRARLLLHEAGMLGLRHGVVVRDQDGGWLAAPDLADPAARVAVQYDGLVHLDRGARRWQADVDRDELTRAAGWQLVVLTGRDLRQPHLAVHKVRAAYERAVGVAPPPLTAAARRAAGFTPWSTSSTP